MKKMANSRYAFIFGRNKLLSLIELVSWLKARAIEYKIDEIGDDYGYCIISSDVDVDEAIRWLGGVVKIAKIKMIDDITSINNMDIEQLGDIFEKFRLEFFDKFNYGVNIFCQGSRKIRQENYEKIKKLLHKWFRQQRFKSMLVKPRLEYREHFLQPHDIINKKLIETKTDFCFFISKSGIHAGYTIKTSNPKQFEFRDVNRPVKNYPEATSIRLAKVLINLAQLKKEELMLDPFCGVGTILQEALLLGINVIGTDLNPKHLDATRKNLNIIKKESETDFRLARCDATMLNECLNLDNKVDSIVTEPYLGPLIKRLPNKKQAIITKQKIEPVYNKFLKQAADILKDDGLLIMVVPFFITKTGIVKLDIDFNDFSIYNPIEEIKPNTIPIEYKRTKIGRIIYILRKN